MSATAFAPSSVGNAGVGFDILGFAVRALGDRVSVQRGDKGVRIKSIEWSIPQPETSLPMKAEKNTATAGLVELAKTLPFGFDVKIEKGIPLSSGLGGSAASAVAGIFAASAVLDTPLTEAEMMHYAMIGESIASGAMHGDNVAPCLLGGLILVRALKPLDMVRLPVPKGLHCALIHPKLRIDTKDARSVIPQALPLPVYVAQSAELASFVAACFLGDAERFCNSCKDLLVEPHRKQLIPGFERAQRAAIEAGAKMMTISGAGPTVFALCQSETIAQGVCDEVQAVFETEGLSVDRWCTPVGSEGVTIAADDALH